jgi:hypothetical protein
LIRRQPNTRVVEIPTHTPINKLGRPYLVFCPQDDLKPRRGTPVCLHDNQWHTITYTRGTGEVAVGIPYPLCHWHGTLTLSRALYRHPQAYEKERREGREDKATSIVPIDRRLNLGPHSGPK